MPEPSVMEFDYLMKEHKQRTLDDLAQAEEARKSADEQRSVSETRLSKVQQELASVTAQLEEFQATYAQRKKDWDDSVVRIQKVLEEREAKVKAGETSLAQRALQSGQREDAIRHQWTVIREIVDRIKASLNDSAVQLAAWHQSIQKALPEIPPSA